LNSIRLTSDLEVWQQFFGSSAPHRWAVGLFFAVIVGGLVIELFFFILERCWLGPTPKAKNHIPAFITGMVERLFFTVLVGGSSNPVAVPALMFTWIAAKLAANWKHPKFPPHPKARAFTMRALLAGLLSMMFALIGGWFISGNWAQKTLPIQLPPF
jgi:hypothetical protein